jgi:ASCH domain
MAAIVLPIRYRPLKQGGDISSSRKGVFLPFFAHRTMVVQMATIELAISIRQPYVEQILLGVKPYEYRTTLTHIRGRVYLYASKKPVDSAAEWRKAKSKPGKLPTGVLVGSVVIAGCKPWRDGGFRYKLEAPKRLRKYLLPNSQPTPKFFKPRV